MGPLHGIRVVEIASIGPGPFAAMLLADMGADVLRLERPGGDPIGSGDWNTLNRGRPSVTCDLRSPSGRQLVLDLAERADVLIEGFRPGVMERHGLGPDTVRARNRRLVYTRVTGYGQDGPAAQVAGHDINYVSIAGALGAIRRRGQPPLFPLNLLADFGGGGMLAAFGVLCGVLEARASGEGQVVDAAMVDGVALLTTAIHAFREAGRWNDEPGTNIVDTGAPFYDVYATSDGGWVAVGAIEPKFYAELLELLGLDPDAFPQHDRTCWPELRARLAERLGSRTRAEWAAILEPAEACATVVYGLADAPDHPHNVARRTFVEVDGVRQPAPAPRFSRTAPPLPTPPAAPGSAPPEVLASWGVTVPAPTR